jgi:hypothetical protein
MSPTRVCKSIVRLNDLNKGDADLKGLITWEVSAYTSSQGSKKSTDTDPVGGGTSRDTKDTRNEEGHIEGKATAHYIRPHTPERGTDAETNEQSTRRVTDVLGRYTELCRQRGKCESHALEPETTCC